MSTLAIIMMVLTMGAVSTVTGYVFYKVFTAPKKREHIGPKDA